MNSDTHLGFLKSLSLCLFPVIFVEAATGSQADCSIQLPCSDPDAAQFTTLPETDEWGEDFIPDEAATDLFLTVGQFDSEFYADFHGVPTADIQLIGVELSLDLEVTQMERSLFNIITPCRFEWVWPVNAQVAANPALGTPDFTVSPQIEGSDMVSLVPGDTYLWNINDPADYSGPTEASGCTSATANLSPYVGSGALSWQLFLSALPTDTGCSNASAQRFVKGIASLSVRYTYCLSDSPPPTVDCSGSEGCTPGYWKNHEERWDDLNGDDFTDTIKHFLSFNAVLGVTEAQSGKADSITLLDAASTGGGGLNALGRHTAAALASSDTSILYAYGVAHVIALYRDAVGADPGPETVSSVHALLEDANEAGCPLSNDYEGPTVCIYCDANEGDCPCAGDTAEGGCRNSTGQGGTLSVTGTTSYSADDLVITASQLPANAPVVWISARQANRDVLGDGLLCIGGLKILRTLVTTSDAGGTTTLGPGIVQMSIDSPVDLAEIFPGSTWHFQAYYRDTANVCGGQANLTNAAQAVFY
jgi:hypothetical protein